MGSALIPLLEMKRSRTVALRRQHENIPLKQFGVLICSVLDKASIHGMREHRLRHIPSHRKDGRGRGRCDTRWVARIRLTSNRENFNAARFAAASLLHKKFIRGVKQLQEK